MMQKEQPGTAPPQDESRGDAEEMHRDDEASVKDRPTQETHLSVEVVDIRIEMIQHRKHEREMSRTLRWPIHSNTPRVTF